MGTTLVLEVDAPTRQEALLASEAAVRALEAVEARLSTWRDDSELARLNRAAVGESFALSAALAADLAAARAGFDATSGAFDPAVGGLVAAWGLRTGGRLPNHETIEAARVPGGFGALELDARSATRTHASLVIEEGGFGKGRGLDAALEAAATAGATRVVFDLGGQVAVLGAGTPHRVEVRRPRSEGTAASSGAAPVELALTHGSLATTGNSERGLVVEGRRIGHVLDARTGRPAHDFGSLTVWAPDATRADVWSTGLYVLGPEAALARAAGDATLGVLVLETLPGGNLRARCDATFARLVTDTEPGLVLELYESP